MFILLTSIALAGLEGGSRYNAPVKCNILGLLRKASVSTIFVGYFDLTVQQSDNSPGYTASKKHLTLPSMTKTCTKDVWVHPYIACCSVGSNFMLLFRRLMDS